MPLFAPDICLARDAAGFGLWRMGHYNEHRQFIPLCAALSTPVTVPDYDIAAWSDNPASVRFWLDAHRQIHDALRQATGLTGIDLAAVDLANDEQFYQWLDVHSTEHALIRQFLGVT